MKWRKKIYLDWVSHKFKAEVAKRSQKFVEFSSFCEQYLRNIVRCKEIAVIKICKIAEQGGGGGGKWVNELFDILGAKINNLL